jgi:hypothetical protein
MPCYRSNRKEKANDLYIDWNKDYVKTTCAICNKEFELSKWRFIGHGEHSCSDECRHKFVGNKLILLYDRRIIIHCSECNVEFETSITKVEKNTNHYCSEKCQHEGMKKLTGNLSLSWQGGITPINVMIRGLREYNEWRTSIYIRDAGKCVLCEKKAHNVHYLKSISYILRIFKIKTREDALNCTILWDTKCKTCHKKVHKNKKVKIQTIEECIQAIQD